MGQIIYDKALEILKHQVLTDSIFIQKSVQTNNPNDRKV